MTPPDEQPSAEYQWYRRKIEDIDRNVRLRRRLEVWEALAHGLVLFSFASIFGYAVQRHAGIEIALAVLGIGATLATYYLNRWRLNRVGRVDLSPVLHSPSGEEGGGGDV